MSTAINEQEAREHAEPSEADGALSPIVLVVVGVPIIAAKLWALGAYLGATAAGGSTCTATPGARRSSTSTTPRGPW